MAHPAHATHSVGTSTADGPSSTPAAFPSALPPVVSPTPDAPAADADYNAILATLTATARGRAFLAEHGRRTRGADTATVLAAIDHIGAARRGEGVPADAPEYLQLGLIAMAGLIAAVENDTSALSTGHETPDSARPRVQRLIGTLRDLSDCIQVMLDSWQPKPEAAPPAPAAPPALMLVEVPPAPAAEPDTSPADEFAADMAVVTAAFDTDATPTVQTVSREEALAVLRSLSDAELIALFT